MTPRVLVTGFGAFPGAPVNPTEALVREVAPQSAQFSGLCDLATALLDVDYRALPARLDAIGAAGCPDIAIHFGLSAAATGFRLERTARNEIRPNAPDNAGFVPERPTICDGADGYAATLPLEDIRDALAARGLPVDFSDDAGGYLCNFLFYHSRAGLCDAFCPGMSGFIHVPPFPGPMAPHGLLLDSLVEGAICIVETSVARWRDDHLHQ